MHHLLDTLMIVLVVLAIVWLRNQRRGSGARAPRLENDARERELEDEVIALRKRIAVLERIATDERKGRGIAAEIDALRD